MYFLDCNEVDESGNVCLPGILINVDHIQVIQRVDSKERRCQIKLVGGYEKQEWLLINMDAAEVVEECRRVDEEGQDRLAEQIAVAIKNE